MVEAVDHGLEIRSSKTRGGRLCDTRVERSQSPP